LRPSSGYLYNAVSTMYEYTERNIRKHLNINFVEDVSSALERSVTYTTVVLTLILPIATIVPYANSLDPYETPSNSASHPDPSCLTLGLQFRKI